MGVSDSYSLPEQDGRPRNILWVDDQIDRYAPWIDQFRKLGTRVDPVSSISQALHNLDKNRYDVVLLDLLLGDGSSLRHLPTIFARAKEARLIVCSSYLFLPDVLDQFKELQPEDQVRISLLDKTSLPFTDDAAAIEKFLADLAIGNKVSRSGGLVTGSELGTHLNNAEHVRLTIGERSEQFNNLRKIFARSAETIRKFEKPSPNPATTELLRRIREHHANDGLSPAEYERLCMEVFADLFDPFLFGFERQSETTDRAHRYDFVCRIKPGHPSWDALRLDFRTRTILFECKNYASLIGANQIHSTERYLMSGALRTVCILISRKGPDAGCLLAAQAAFRESGKFILLLSDLDLEEMLKLKIRETDPTPYIDDKIWKFITTLPR